MRSLAILAALLSFAAAFRNDFSEFSNVTLGTGLIWRSAYGISLFGGNQSINVLDVDLNLGTVRIVPLSKDAEYLCTRTSVMAQEVDAIAAINGGFFGANADAGLSCASIALVKRENEILATTAVRYGARSTIGWNNPLREPPKIRLTDNQDTFPEVANAMGGGPNLVTNGVVNVTTADENFDDGYGEGPKPCTGSCVTADNRLLLFTIDGRTEAGRGVSLPEFAEYMISLGCVNGMNSDGGGSTTMYVRGYGVVNYPSDAEGERRVASAYALFVDSE
eukprot:TRINITY_DN5590_c0_g1_i1.p1 TRINITY_DN5590_c0_g1~~TRINITY_DN5590_c0_g1_i1.p1  ORF type:complete len:286 (+),score=56.70 TRINITY_DN5590_c0_g1_i1:25-858(+)